MHFQGPTTIIACCVFTICFEHLFGVDHMKALQTALGFNSSLLIQLLLFGLGIAVCAEENSVSPTRRESGDRPNIVVIFIDDLGFADIKPFGQPAYSTPNINRMAREGRVFTDFSVSSAVCSASRAALLTGCYHARVGIHGALWPNSQVGIAAEETTLGEICKSRGYATACIGKWHLGDHKSFLPLQHGFDEYLGLPYSNDMWPLHPDLLKLSADVAKRRGGYPPLAMYDGNEIIDAEVTAEDQTRLTTSYTERAVEFIQKNREHPFLLYLPHTMVHVPLFVSPLNAGKSKLGLFADVMWEIDWSVGQIIDTLDRLKLSENTLVVFTSDNGPWLSYGNHAGSALPLREGKGTSFEGGVRVPTIMRWTRKIPARTQCDEFAATIDILPTVANLIGADLPPLPIDGLDIGPQMFEPSPPPSPHENYYIYYANNELQAVRDRQWKLVLPHNYRTLGQQTGGVDGLPAPYRQVTAELALYDLKADRGEQDNVLSDQPDIVARLQRAADSARAKFGDSLTNSKGSEVRGPGRIPQ